MTKYGKNYQQLNEADTAVQSGDFLVIEGNTSYYIYGMNKKTGDIVSLPDRFSDDGWDKKDINLAYSAAKDEMENNFPPFLEAHELKILKSVFTVVK